jgi:ADP-ribose pyrophosphatase YjhB (NUDIX family)
MPRSVARYCPYCATPLALADDHGSMRPTCPACGFIAYRNPAPAVGVILEKKNRIVLVRRRYEPQAGLWGLPAGFMEYGETPEQTAIREVREETGLTVEIDRLHGAYRGGSQAGARVLLLVYLASIRAGRLRAGDDAEAVDWFEFGAFPELAFTSHRRALREYDAARAARDSLSRPRRPR